MLKKYCNATSNKLKINKIWSDTKNVLYDRFFASNQNFIVLHV